MIPGVLFGISIKFSSHGTILWNLEDRAFCGPNGAVPYTRNENNPIPGVAGGTLIEKIGEDATDSFIIGESREIQPPNPDDYTWVLMRIALLIMKAYSGPG